MKQPFVFIWSLSLLSFPHLHSVHPTPPLYLLVYLPVPLFLSLFLVVIFNSNSVSLHFDVPLFSLFFLFHFYLSLSPFYSLFFYFLKVPCSKIRETLIIIIWLYETMKKKRIRINKKLTSLLLTSYSAVWIWMHMSIFLCLANRL